MNLYFNELSLILVSTLDESKKIFKNFLESCIMLHNITNSNSTSIFAQSLPNFQNIEWYNLSIYNNYSLSKWIDDISEDENTDKDILKLFKIMIANKFDPLVYPEFRLKNNVLIGLGAAYENNSLAVSFGIGIYCSSILKIEKMSLPDLIPIEIEVKNIFNYKSIQDHLNFILENNFQLDDRIYPTLQIPFPNNDIINKLFTGIHDFNIFQSEEKDNTNSRIPKIERIAACIARINGYIFDEGISNKNPLHSHIYSPANVKGRKKFYISLDTATPAFEVLDNNGNHKGEWSLLGDFKEKKPQKKNHNITV